MIQTANFMTPHDNALYKLSDLRGTVVIVWKGFRYELFLCTGDFRVR